MTDKNKTATTGNSDGKKCHSCGKDHIEGNFCCGCGQKMVEECTCWILNRRFNCGHNECPTLVELVKEFGGLLFPTQ